MEQNQEPVPEIIDLARLRENMAPEELSTLQERLREQFKDGELLKLPVEEIKERVNAWLAQQKSMTAPDVAHPPAEISIDQATGTMTIKIDRRNYPWIKPTIGDYLQDWCKQIHTDTPQLVVSEEDSAHWTREDWLNEFRRVGGALSKQMSLSPTDSVALAQAEDAFVLFRKLAEVCGHSITIEYPEGTQEPSNELVLCGIEFNYEIKEAKDAGG